MLLCQAAALHADGRKPFAGTLPDGGHDELRSAQALPGGLLGFLSDVSSLGCLDLRILCSFVLFYLVLLGEDV